MGVRFACHACQRRLNVKSELAGKKGKCPSCGSRFWIPQQDSEYSVPLSGHSEEAPKGVSPQESTSADRPTEASASPAAPPSAARENATVGDPTDGPPETTTPVSSPAEARPVQPVSAPPPPPAPPPAPGPADVLSADPNALWYVRPPTGGQYGPATGTLLKEWIAEGRVGAASLLWREGWAQWRRAEEVVSEWLPSSDAAVGGPQLPDVLPATSGLPSDAVTGEPQDPTAEDRGGSDPAAPGQIKRQRKHRRITVISTLVGVSLLLLLVLIFVISRGLGE